ncbi:hypothetical protein JM18_002675 [Phytophthora kernoviae]|uniref:IQCH-like ATP-grasp domain-containing protein n=2 Tax=Phytophthora kernoviae TaxID=325452 RepID=A0A8T0M5Q4_9STRA|nr:hypothetical protein G195_004055 [Phytophthora kernoviae 00238/432]KAG2528093.1 hypothetical protein JM16_003058 [Phytophthora kernoviae]KAG2529789.1 hypothetical protein JM18_002675 [Phytophthora kernoviae]
MEKMQQQHHVEDVGRLLLQTQEQLRVMREQMTAAAEAVEANASPMRHSTVVTTAEVQAFNAILQKTEMELRAKAELVLNGMVNSSSNDQSNQNQHGTLLPAVTVGAPPSIRLRGGYDSVGKPKMTTRKDGGSIPMEFFREDDDLSDEDQGAAGNDRDEDAEMEELGANVDKIRGYNELLDAYSLHQFLIHKGRTMRDTPEFVSFRRVAQEQWGNVEDALRALEALLTQYFVPLAYIDGQRLLSLAATAENFAVQQNLQLTRICAAALDSNVDLLVYVSPFELTADVSQYFLKLLQLGGLADSRPRVKLVFPEQALRFPTGKDAYLVMGLPGAEDQRLAIALDLPILGAPPAQALPLLTRSGGKRLLIRADVNVPTGTYELYDDHELFAALAKLAVTHMDQPRWLLKLDYDPLGVGEAIIDLSGMQAMRELRREKRAPEYWRQPGPRDAAAKLLLAELEKPGMLAKHAAPVHTEIFPSWREFTEAIAHFGCVIEAAPPTAISGLNVAVSPEAPATSVEPSYVRANLFVNPDGTVHVTSTQNVLASGSGLNRKTVAYTFPQTAAPHEAVKGACSATGRLLVEISVWGYVSVDFVVFQDEKSSGAPRLWALAVHPYLTNSAASFACFHLLARGSLDSNSGVYKVASTNTLATGNPGRSSSGGGMTELLLREASLAKDRHLGTPRSYVVCSYVFHPHVTTMQYSAFFHACRLHGVCFDVERTLGTLFLLTDSLTAGVFGVLSVGETTDGALAFLRTALEVIGREAGATIEMAASRSHSAHSGNFAQVLSAIRASTGGGKGDRLGKARRLRS